MRGLILLPLLLLAGCGTNHNDVMVAFYNAQGVLGKASSDNNVEIARYEAEKVASLANATTGGVEIVDPSSGFVTTYKNPNPYLFGGVNSGTLTATNPVKSPQMALRAPVKSPSWWSKAGGFTLGILGKTLDTALANAVPYIGMIENNKTQRANYEYAYLSDEAMFSSIQGITEAGFLSNTSISTQALSSMQTTAESAVGNMQLLGTNLSEQETIRYGHTMAAVRDMNASNNETLQTAIENPLTNVTETNSSSNSSSFTEQYPDWTEWPVVTP